MTEAAIVWAWRHFVLNASPYDDLDEAVRMAFSGHESGSQALQSIEVVKSDGTREVHGLDAVLEMFTPLEDEEVRRYAERPSATVVLDLPAPDGSWAVFRNFVEEQHAEDEAETWRRRLGPDRVRVRQIQKARA